MSEIEQGIAGADLSAAQYLAVYSDGTDAESVKLLVTDTLVTGLGILVNAPADTGIAKYVYSGFANATAGAVFEPHDELMVNGSGQLIKATTGKAIIAKYMPKPRGTANGPDAAAGVTVRVYVYANKTRLLA